METQVETGIREQVHSVDTDPQKVHKLDYSANEQSKTIQTSYYIGDVQTVLATQEGVSLRGWNNLEMDILDIPLWQLMGSKEVKNTQGVYISKPKIADYGFSKLKGFEIVFKDVSLSCINTDGSQNSYQTIHDPIIEIRKRCRGIDSQYLEEDWNGVTAFYDEDYGDSIKITNGAGSMTFKLSGHYVRTPKNILKNVNNWDDDDLLPMRLGDFLFPIMLDRLNYSNNGTGSNNIIPKQKGSTRRYTYDGPTETFNEEGRIGLYSTNYNSAIQYATSSSVINLGTQLMNRMGQWPSDVIDYALEIRVRNLPQVNNNTSNVVWNLTYGIEIKSTWDCMSFEPSIYQDSALLIPTSTLKALRSNKQFGWLNKVVKVLANAFIDWLVPLKIKEQENRLKNIEKLMTEE